MLHQKNAWITLLFFFLFSTLYAQFDVDIDDYDDPSDGSYFDITVEITGINYSTASRFYLDVSFPQGVQSVEVRNEYDFDDADVHNPGDGIFHKSNYSFPAQYHLVSAYIDGYSGYEDLRLKIRVYPNQSGILDIYYRATEVTTSGTTYTEPSDWGGDDTDQQGWRVYTEEHTHQPDELPDLIISRITVNNGQSVTEGQQVPITVYIEEINGEDAGEGYIALYVDGQHVDTRKAGNVSANDEDDETFDYTFPSSGSYSIRAEADPYDDIPEDNEGNNEKTITTYVNEGNAPPVLAPIGNKSVDENELLQFSVSASDPDQDNLTYSVGALPQGATFQSQTFSWRPTYDQAGSYEVTFYVSDGNGGQDQETITITVVDVVLNSISLTYPLGGELFVVGKEQTITWGYTGTPESIVLQVSRDAGVSWETIQTYTNQSADNYVWDVTGPETAAAKIRVIASYPEGAKSDESGTLRIADEYTYIPPESWPLSGSQLGVRIPQGGYFGMDIHVGTSQGIQYIQTTFTSIDPLDEFIIRVYSPQGEEVYTDTLKETEQHFRKEAPLPGRWRITVDGLHVWNGEIHIGVDMKSSVYTEAFSSLYYERQDAMQALKQGIYLLQMSGSGDTWSVLAGLATGVCGTDDYACMGSDIVVGFVPVVGTVKDVVQTVVSTLIGSGMKVVSFFNGDEQTSQKADEYFISAGFAAVGVVGVFVGAYYIDEVAKAAKYGKVIAESGALMKKAATLNIDDLGPSAAKIGTASDKLRFVKKEAQELIDFRNDKLPLIHSNQGNLRGAQFEFDMKLRALGNTFEHFETATEFVGRYGTDAPEVTRGMDVVLWAKLKPNAKGASVLDWDYSTTKIGVGATRPSDLSSSYKQLTDVDIILKDKETGEYALIFVKRGDDTEAFAKNSEQLYKVRESIAMSPDMEVFKNSDTFGIVGPDLMIQPSMVAKNSTFQPLDSIYVHNLKTTPVFVDSIYYTTQGNIALEFHTEGEESNKGMYVYRSIAEENDFSLVSPLIVGHGTDQSYHEYLFTDDGIVEGTKYQYLIHQIHSVGFETFISDTINSPTITSVEEEVEVTFSLQQNYPNPFNPETVIPYSVAEPSHVRIDIYNILGEKIETLENTKKQAGLHQVIWNATHIPSGMYIYNIYTDTGYKEAKKALLLK